MSIEVRASSFGGCTKAQVAACLGYTPMDTPEHMREVFDRGHTHEDENAAALRDDGWIICDEQTEVRLHFDSGVIVGHIDGKVLRLAITPRLWESKSPGAWAKFEKAHKTGTYDDPLTQKYAWQISVYMLALDLEAYVTCWDEEHGVRGFVIETPPYTMHDVELRVREIAEAVEVGTLPMLCSTRDYPCPFNYLGCATGADEREPVLDPAVKAASERYAELSRIEAAAKKEKKELRPTMDAYYTRLGKWEAGKALVTIYEHTERRLDEDAMRADGIDVEKYRTEKKSNRLRVGDE